MARSHPRWQMTTRSRFAIALGLAGLAVAGVQLLMLSDPPTVLQLVVVAFWSVVGVAYLGSAVAQRVRARRRPAPAAPMPPPLDEIVPVPVRPARPRARTGNADEAPPATSGDRTPPPGSGHAPSEPAGTTRVALRSRRPETAGARDAPAASRAEPAARPAPAVPPVPAMALVPSARTPGATPTGRARPVSSPTPTPNPTPPPAPSPTPEETTDAFTVRTPPRADPEPRRGRHTSGSHARGDGLGSALSFGPARGTAVAVAPGRPEARRAGTSTGGQPRVGPSSPSARPAATSLTPAAGPAATGEGPVTPRGPGAHAVAATSGTGSVPAPRARHRADVEDPVAARRGGADGAAPARGRHASDEAPPVAARGGR